jgi:RNAse (barnase) inhibitor barstar
MNPDDNGIHPLPDGEEVFPVLDGALLQDKTALLAALGEALSFPDWYGANWDALADCLMDMSWSEGPVRLHLANANALPTELREPLEEVFQEAADYWQERGRACRLYLS